MKALGAALYHDRSLVEDHRPIDTLFDALVAGDDGLEQFSVPLAPRKEAPRAFRRDALLERVRRGELASFLVRTAPSVLDADAITIGFLLSPATAAAQEGRAGYRFRVDVALGAAVVARRGLPSIVDALLALANAVEPSAGVVFPADSASFAHAYASGTRGGLSDEEDKRVKDVFYAVYELGDRIRGPEWGTFLAAHHVDKLGGAERVTRDSGAAVVRPLSGGGLYLQAAERLDDLHSLASLSSFLQPVR